MKATRSAMLSRIAPMLQACISLALTASCHSFYQLESSVSWAPAPPAEMENLLRRTGREAHFMGTRGDRDSIDGHVFHIRTPGGMEAPESVDYEELTYVDLLTKKRIAVLRTIWVDAIPDRLQLMRAIELQRALFEELRRANGSAADRFELRVGGAWTPRDVESIVPELASSLSDDGPVIPP